MLRPPEEQPNSLKLAHLNQLISSRTKPSSWGLSARANAGLACLSTINTLHMQPFDGSHKHEQDPSKLATTLLHQLSLAALVHLSTNPSVTHNIQAMWAHLAYPPGGTLASSSLIAVCVEDMAVGHSVQLFSCF